MNTLLTRVDPEKRMDRWYSVAVGPTLLEPLAVVCVWGSRRSRYQRAQGHPAASAEAAQATAERIVRAKVRRGYRPTP
jgi:predicted DNA-binding WGR domain protein